MNKSVENHKSVVILENSVVATNFCIKLKLNLKKENNKKLKGYLSSIFDYLKNANIKFDSIFDSQFLDFL